MRLWILGTARGRPSYTISKKQPPKWEYDGFWHIGKCNTWDASMTMDIEMVKYFKADKIPPGEWREYAFGKVSRLVSGRSKPS